MISREEAKKKIKQIVANNQPIKTGATLPIRTGQKFDVFRIPIDLLVPNINNDRITWKIREYEAESGKTLNIESDDDISYLYDTILKEHPAENERTKADLAQKGQQVDGVISEDGIIIDGNRRATLLRALFNGDADKYNKNVEEFRYFNTIVLPGDIDEKEIMALETMLQIGTDEKVKYNRICLYVKVDNLLRAGYTYPQIRQYMNLKNDSEVGDMKSTYDLMVEYLKAINKPDHFTLLDGLEDQFLNVKKVFNRLDNGTYSAEWDYQPTDIADFKMVCYDYMRSKFEGKRFRDVLVGKPNKTNGVFIEKTVWDNFLNNHNNIIESNDPESEKEWEYLGKKGGKFDQNLNHAVKQLESVLTDKDLSKLISEVSGKVDRIDELTDNVPEISVEDLKRLFAMSKHMYKITQKFERPKD